MLRPHQLNSCNTNMHCLFDTGERLPYPVQVEQSECSSNQSLDQPASTTKEPLALIDRNNSHREDITKPDKSAGVVGTSQGHYTYPHSERQSKKGAIVEKKTLNHVWETTQKLSNNLTTDISIREDIIPVYPRNPTYRSMNIRLSSFSKWPKRNPTARYMAECGLFYTGFKDSVKCFHCDVGIRDWDDLDDPWIEHARMQPHCPYVREHKGDDFVRFVQLSANLEDQLAARSTKNDRLQTGAVTSSSRDSNERVNYKVWKAEDLGIETTIERVKADSLRRGKNPANPRDSISKRDESRAFQSESGSVECQEDLERLKYTL